MLRISIAILFAFLGKEVFAQSFNARISNNSFLGNYLQGIGAQSVYLNEADSSIVMITGSNGSWKNITARRFDYNLNLLDSTFFSFSVTGFVHSRPFSFDKISETKSALLLDFYDTSYYTKLFLLNNTLDTLKSATIKSDTIWRVYSYDFLVEDSTITVLSQLNRHLYNDQQLLITQFDTALNPLWQTTIEDWRGQQGGYFPMRIIRLHDAYYIAGRCEYPNWIEGFLDKIDLSGNLIWDKRYRNGLGNSGAQSLIAVNDTLYLVNNDNSSTGWDIAMWLLKVDTAGNTLADSIYAPVSFLQSQDILQTKDGNVVIVGYYDNNFTYNANGLIYKLDRNFNILWQRSYVHQSSYDENRLWRIHEWPDGSLLATGSLEWWYNRPPGVPHDHVWLLSLDSSGCLAPNNCGVLAVPEEEFWPQRTGALQLYPNPATTAVTLNLTGFNGQATISLYNLQGQKLHGQTLEFTQGQATLTLPLGLPVGTYLITLKTKTDAYTTKLVVIQ